MTPNLYSKGILLLSIIVVIIAFDSCAPTKQAAYFRERDSISNLNMPDKVIYIEPDSLYRINKGDELYISVATAENEPNSFSSGTDGLGATNIELISYLVDELGYLKLPYIDTILVMGLTVDEASRTIQQELSQYLYQPTVMLKLINSRITVLGEVASPGMYIVNNKPINIYQALAYAGDISVYGNRRNVLLIREENDQVKKKYLDLTSDEIIGTPWYTLQPDDIVYVEPMRRKILGTETVPWDLITSAISTTIVIMTFMITITN